MTTRPAATATTRPVVTHHVMGSPVGPLTLVAHDHRLAGLYMDGQRHRPDGVQGDRDPGAFRAAVEQLDAYFAGERTAFDLPLRLAGTAFQQLVWAELQTIPYGTTVSYGELARRIGRPGASRAVGLANGRNPVGIIVPCHRVVGATGSLTGYGGGIDRKRRLLDHERGHLSPDLWGPFPCPDDRPGLRGAGAES